MYKWCDPQLAVDPLIELFDHIPVPHKHGLPRVRLHLFRLQGAPLTWHEGAPQSCVSVVDLAEDVLLQGVSQVISVREVEACLLDLA